MDRKTSYPLSQPLTPNKATAIAAPRSLILSSRIAAYALPLPLTIISDLLGVPLRRSVVMPAISRAAQERSRRIATNGGFAPTNDVSRELTATAKLTLVLSRQQPLRRSRFDHCPCLPATPFPAFLRVASALAGSSMRVDRDALPRDH